MPEQTIEHAGYHRNIISQNPHRYDQDGEELEDDEEDEEADATAAQANPYDGILLHGKRLSPVLSVQLLTLISYRIAWPISVCRGPPHSPITVGSLPVPGTQ